MPRNMPRLFQKKRQWVETLTRFCHDMHLHATTCHDLAHTFHQQIRLLFSLIRQSVQIDAPHDVVSLPASCLSDVCIRHTHGMSKGYIVMAEVMQAELHASMETCGNCASKSVCKGVWCQGYNSTTFAL